MAAEARRARGRRAFLFIGGGEDKWPGGTVLASLP
jgi:hypothetical protein